MLYEHLRLTTIEVTARLQGDYIADINAYDMVQNEILKCLVFCKWNYRTIPRFILNKNNLI